MDKDLQKEEFKNRNEKKNSKEKIMYNEVLKGSCIIILVHSTILSK